MKQTRGTNNNQGGTRITSTRPDHYWLCGLRIASQIQLPQVEHAPMNSLQVDAEIRISPIRISPEELRYAAPGWRIGHKRLHLNVPEVAHFLIREGREILVEPLPDADASEITTLLLGPVFGALCHQRGLLPMQASAARYHNRCFAFLSDRSASRIMRPPPSQQNSSHILPDDVCIIDTRAQGGPLLYPGHRQARLWAQRSGAQRERSNNREGLSRSVSRPPPFNKERPPQALPLSRLYVLCRHGSASSPSIERLPRPEALSQLVRSTYQPFLIELLGRDSTHLDACTELAYRIPVFRLMGGRELSLLEARDEVITQHHLYAEVGTKSSYLN